MAIFLFIVPILALTASLFLYKHTGKREFLKLDLVQFTYGFVVLPIMFVWLKSFLYFILRSEIDVSLAPGDLFLVDTIFSTIFMFVYAFVVIHSLTTSFNLKYYRDPLYDVFEHSEYYHLWLSHVAMYSGAGFIATLLSMVNIWIPVDTAIGKPWFLASLLLAMVGGVLFFVVLWLSDPKQAQFLRLMKLVIGLLFLIHAGIYFVYSPAFDFTRIVYWAMFVILAVMVLCSVTFHRSERAIRWIDKFKHQLWVFGNVGAKKKKLKIK